MNIKNIKFISLLGLCFCCLLSLFVPSTNTFANEVDLSSWMSKIPSDTPISSLSIPGTHESAATKGIKIFGKDYGKCQYGSYQSVISDQLNMGCRFLDIRCRYLNANNFAIHHGDIYQNINFGDVLNSCQTFLNNHPTETIFMRIKQEKSSVSDAEFKKTFLSYVNRYPSLFWNDQQNKQPKLGDLRGRVVVLYNVSGLNFGLDYAHGLFDIQDNYETSSVDEKWQSFLTHLKKHHPNSSINYLSAQGNAKKTPEDLAKQLNPRLVHELENNNYNNVGIIATDFLTNDIAKKIVETNSAIKNAVNNYAFYMVTGDETYLSTKYGNLVVWKEKNAAAPAADVTITKADGTKMPTFDPASEQTLGKWVEKGKLEIGDTIEITAKQNWRNYSDSTPLKVNLTDKQTKRLVVTETGALEVKEMVTTCHIVPVSAPTKCLDNNPNNTNLFLWSKVNQAANHWFTFHTVKEDIVKISSKDNSRWLTTKGVQGNTITQTRNEQEASYWQMKHLDNNKIVLHYMGNKEAEIKDTNLSLNICGGKSTDGTLAIRYSLPIIII